MVLTSGFDNGGSAYNRAATSTCPPPTSRAGVARSTRATTPTETAHPPGLAPRKHVQDVLWIPPRVRRSTTTTSRTRSCRTAASMSPWAGTDVGSYKAATASYYYNGSSSTNHDVLIVGWDDNYAAANFATAPPGNGAFIVKNSWGTVLGQRRLLLRVLLRHQVRPRQQSHGGVRRRRVDEPTTPASISTTRWVTAATWGTRARPAGSPTSSPPRRPLPQRRRLLHAVPEHDYQVYTGSTLASKTLNTSGTQAAHGLSHSLAVDARRAGQRSALHRGGEGHLAGLRPTLSPLESPFANYSSAATAAGRTELHQFQRVDLDGYHYS